MMIMSTLYETNTLILIFIVLAHWNNLDTLSRFRTNQSLLLLLVLVMRGSNPWSTALTSNMVFITLLMRTIVKYFSFKFYMYISFICFVCGVWFCFNKYISFIFYFCFFINFIVHQQYIYTHTQKRKSPKNDKYVVVCF